MEITLEGKCDCCSYPEEKRLTITEHRRDQVLIRISSHGESEIVLSEDEFDKMVQIGKILFNR